MEHAIPSERIKTMKRLIIVAFAVLIPLSATACHTIQGAGQDVTAVGKGMEDATK